MNTSRSFFAAAISLILMVVGAFGPWATVLGIRTINGTTGGRDGWVVIGAAGVAAIVLLIIMATRRRWLAIIPLLAGAAAAATAAYDITDINSLYNGAVASAQWGIYLALVGSIGLIVSSIWVIAEVRRPPKAATSEPVEPEAAAESVPPAAPQA
jgi:hypothetical protein